jgi:hypothetical protein
VHISWHYDGPPSEAVEFVIQYKPKLAAASEPSEVVGLKTNYYTVQGLNPFTEYEFYVVAVSAIGRGLASTATFVTTGETGKYRRNPPPPVPCRECVRQHPAVESLSPTLIIKYA